MTVKKVIVEEKKNKVTVSSDGVKVAIVGVQGPPGTSEIAGKSVESNPTLNGGEFIVFDATDDRFEFSTTVDGGVI